MFALPKNAYCKVEKVPCIRTFKLQTFKDVNMARDRTKREEEVTEELKRFTMQDIARGFSLFERALLVVDTQDCRM